MVPPVFERGRLDTSLEAESLYLVPDLSADNWFVVVLDGISVTDSCVRTKSRAF